MVKIKTRLGNFLRNGITKTEVVEIAPEERKRIQLEMLAEFDAFCRAHHVRYSLGYGTLLGAVRHKGFIPWDDDVDLVVPLPDMLYIKQNLNSDTLAFCDADTEMNYEFSFPRLSYKNTCQRIGLKATKYGINIDMYVMLGISADKSERAIYYKEANALQKTRMRARRASTVLFNLLPISSLPFLNKAIKAMRNHMLYSPVTVPYDEASVYYCVSGYRDERAVYDYDLFDKLIDAPFENLTLKITSNFDRFLANEYGDYMLLPPESERHPYHGGHYYWNR